MPKENNYFFKIMINLNSPKEQLWIPPGIDTIIAQDQKLIAEGLIDPDFPYPDLDDHDLVDGYPALPDWLTKVTLDLYDSLTSTAAHKAISAHDFLDGIRRGRWEKETTEYRESRHSGASEEDLKALKRALPAVSLSGCVTAGTRKGAPGEGRFAHCGLLQCDFDGKDHSFSVDEIRAILLTDQTVFAFWDSVSGNGVKALVLIPRDVKKHKAAFKTVELHFSKKGLVMDPSTKDPGRLCTVSHDSRMHFNCQNVEPFKIDPRFVAEGDAANMVNHLDRKLSIACVREMLSCIPRRQDYDPWYKIVAAVFKALRPEDALKTLKEWHPEEEPGEYEKIGRSDLSQIRVGTLIHHARRHGFDGPIENEPTPFPVHALPGFAGAMATETQRATTSGSMPLAAFWILGTLSATLGGGLVVQSGPDRVTRANLFLLANAASGIGKTESFEKIARALLDHDKKSGEEFLRGELPSLKSRQKLLTSRLKDLESKIKKADPKGRADIEKEHELLTVELEEVELKIDSPPCWVVGDTTKEALAIAMAGQKGEAIASMSPDARGIVKVVRGRYNDGDGDEDFYCQSYSGDSIRINRVKRPPLILHHPCLAIVWMIHQDVWREMHGSEALRLSGFLARFLMFDSRAEARKSHEICSGMKEEVIRGWEKLIQDLLENFRTSDQPTIIKVDPDALDAMTAYSDENVDRRNSGGDLADLASYVARWAENAWRLSVILHAARHGADAGKFTLSLETAKQTIELARWFSEQQLDLLRAGRIDHDLKQVSGILALLADGGGEFNLRMMKRQLKVSSEEIQRLVEEYSLEVEIVDRQGDKGRPSKWLVEKSRKGGGKSESSN